jgi:hypothetical protein
LHDVEKKGKMGPGDALRWVTVIGRPDQAAQREEGWLRWSVPQRCDVDVEIPVVSVHDGVVRVADLEVVISAR